MSAPGRNIGRPVRTGRCAVPKNRWRAWRNPARCPAPTAGSSCSRSGRAPHTIDNMPEPLRWNRPLHPEPSLPEAVEEALDALKIASSHAVVEWLEKHRPQVFQKEARDSLAQGFRIAQRPLRRCVIPRPRAAAGRRMIPFSRAVSPWRFWGRSSPRSAGRPASGPAP